MTVDITPPIYRWLSEDADVANMVGVRIYGAGTAPQGVRTPYITWQLVTGEEEHYTDEDTNANACRVQINYWAERAGDQRQLARLAGAALKAHGRKLMDLRDEQDTETQRYVFSSDWLFWLT